MGQTQKFLLSLYYSRLFIDSVPPSYDIWLQASFYVRKHGVGGKREKVLWRTDGLVVKLLVQDLGELFKSAFPQTSCDPEEFN